MRQTPLVGEKLWFGPRRFGWGWDPVSWHGWAVLIATCVVAVKAPSTIISLSVIAALIVCCVLKGTSPGGPAARKQLKQSRGDPPLVHGGGDDLPDLRGITRKMQNRRR